jgi:spore germination cell wall hydrolase CwlJ-like protein
MKPLEEFQCENKIQQVIREQYWIVKLKPDMNCLPAYLTEEGKVVGRQNAIKKYTDTHVEKVNETIKKYRENHKEQLNDKAKEYYHTIKDNDEYKTKKKEYLKKYRETHKEQLNEKQRINRSKLHQSRNTL